MTIHPAVYADNEAQRKSLAASYGAFNDNSLNFSAKSSENELLHDRILASRLTLSAESLMGEKMSDISKEVLNAKLAQNKAEVSSVASDVKTEMANFRTHYTQQFSSIEKGISEIKGEIGGLKTSLTTTQWSMNLGLGLVTVVLSGVMLASSWIISSKESSPSQQQPIVIQVPQQSPVQQLPQIQQPQKN